MIGLLFAILPMQVVPYPPPTTTEPPEIESGDCVIVGIAGGEDVTPSLIVRCGISDDVSRLFELPIDADGETILRWIVDQLPDKDDELFEVH